MTSFFIDHIAFLSFQTNFGSDSIFNHYILLHEELEKFDFILILGWEAKE